MKITGCLDFCTPVIFASSKVISHHKKVLKLNTSIHGIDSLEKNSSTKIKFVKCLEGNDRCLNWVSQAKLLENMPYSHWKSATEALKNGDVDILVTAPIDKNNIQSEEFDFQGHTEFLEQ